MILTDYAILQRNHEGVAYGEVSGTIPEEFKGRKLGVFVYQEDDELPVIFWQECEIREDTYNARLELPTGGLYRVEVMALVPEQYHPYVRIRHIRHIGVGELYLLTGQSNMAGYGRQTAYDPPELGVHLFGNNGKWQLAAHPLNDGSDSIFPENRELTSGSSPALSFARTMHRRLGVPIGLVQASLGGSPLRDWHPEEDGSLYRAMMRRIPMTGEVGGILWYQGCAEADGIVESDGYYARFERMIQLWRRELGNLPVVICQLNRCAWQTPSEEYDRSWGKIRNAQRLAARNMDKVYAVPTVDLPMNEALHNSSGANIIMGERMANVLLENYYGVRGLQAPNVKRVVMKAEDEVQLVFDQPFSFQIPNADRQPLEMDVEDGEGLNPAVHVRAEDGGLRVKLSRPIHGEACFHAFWRSSVLTYLPVSRQGMPPLACYGVLVEKEEGTIQTVRR